MNVHEIASAELGDLPLWNLDDLYPGPESAELEADFQRAESLAAAFRGAFQGRVATLSGAELAAAIGQYETLMDVFGRIGSYAGLLHAGDVSDPKLGQFYQTTSERTTRIGSGTLFFALELNEIPEAAFAATAAAAELERWRPWLRDLRAFQPHQLSREIEELLYEKYVAGPSAWSRLHEQTLAALRFPIGGVDLTSGEALDLLSSPDRAKREEAAHVLARVLKDAVPTLSLVLNTLAKDKEIEDRWRHFPRPISSRNLSNLVEDEVVDALLSAVRAAFPRLSHRYYAMKARWLGLEKLEYWDRNAPLPKADDRIIPWNEARDIVLGAYRDFSPRLAEVGGRFFTEGWIDAPLRPGKSPGAFAHPTVPSAHPYILVNYLGRVRDVMTVAHELGHGVHQVLAGRQGALMAGTPLTLAETASVFGEMLTFRRLLADAKDPTARKIMLASKVEDMLNTVVRQVAFAEFERRFHDERAHGEVTGERIGEIWLEVQTESLGPAFHFAPGYEVYWSYISHFIHSPFYVYSYAFGDCLVNSLYAAYQNAADGFAERYLDMLAAGGTRRHKELLAPFGLDATDPDFWSQGLRVIEGFIDELERLE